ncbi:poly polymerase 2 [Caerostris extrusa]|uniref:Poly [ADP-ribose] polymerase n=1 Tax=Caerostris extrusa TaxID=172846 RepID=A0AAV4TCD4_CAEEX|nr:poly polymerase 2 [Caerostris extrusa]
MSNSVGTYNFVWQYEQRKRWVTYSEDQIEIINQAHKEKQSSVLISGKTAAQSFTLDFNKMVQVNQKSRYEKRIRSLITSSDCNSVWLWKDAKEEWHCYKPYLAFHFEVAYLKKDTIFKFYDNGDYEINFETWLQLNEENGDINPIKRETVELSISAKLNDICSQNDKLLKRMCSNDVPSAKRIKFDPNPVDKNILNIPKKMFSPLDLDKSANSDQISSDSHSIIPVDSECPEKDNFHIYCKDGVIYNATLNQTNMQNNNNKFYIIQLLEHNDKKLYAVWRRWGRVGQKGQRDLTKYGSSFSEANASFDQKFYDKTRNKWADFKNFVHVKGKYDLLHMDLVNLDSVPKPIKTVKTDVKSKLASTIQSLMEIICDQKRMEDHMKEMSYDSNRTPLGKLTLKQVQEGYVALNKVAVVLAAGGKGSALINACNDFYTKIPHNFGMKVPPLIQSQNDIDEKLKMLEALSNITVAMSVFNSKSDREEHHLDKYYRSLNCCLDVLNPTSSEYVEIETCLKGTHGFTHTAYEMEIIDAFKCSKIQEDSSFKNYENKLLLWHGSRITNWMGILKEGLRIAPPEAPCTGYMFGKGVYFADVSSKSANYCYATKRKNEGLLLMCEVFVGNQFELTDSNSDLPIGLPSDFSSVLGKGRVSPSTFKTGVLS